MIIIDAKTIIKNAMTTTGFTLTRIVQELNNIGIDTTLQNLSNKLSRDTIRFYEVEQVLNVMGLTLFPQHVNLDFDIRSALYPHLNQQEIEYIMSMVADNRVPYQFKIYFRNLLVQSQHNCREVVYNFEKAVKHHINQPTTMQ